MIRRSLNFTAAALVIAASTFTPVASHAMSMFGNGTATQPKVKMVHMTLRNKSDAAMNLMVGDQAITIAANSEYALAAPAGTNVYGADKAVKVIVTKDLDGTVCSFR